MTLTCPTCGTSYPRVLPRCPGCAAGASAPVAAPEAPPPPPGSHRWLGALFLAPALVMGYFAVQQAGHSLHLVREGQHVTGEVVDLEARRGSKGSTTYYPVVRFPAPDGRLITARSRTGSSPPSYSVGDQVRLHYDRDRPHDFLLDGFWELWFAPLLMGVMAPLFGGVGLGMLLGKITPRRSGQPGARHQVTLSLGRRRRP